jgi:hypothetical protein
MTSKLHTARAVLAGVLVALPALPVAAVAPREQPPIYREGEVLVRYRAGAGAGEVDAIKGRLGLWAKRALDGGPRTELLALPSMTTTAAALEVLRADPAVEVAEPNFRRYLRAVTPNDPLFGQQWGLSNTGQANFFSPFTPGVVGADMNLSQAWDADGDGTADRTGVPAVIVAVIDDAVQTAHPDLAANILPGRNFVECQKDDDPNPISNNGQHGTLVSGCIVGIGNNGVGIAGVAWNASLLPIKFAFDSAGHIAAMNWARDHGAKIINASFGGPGFSQLEQDTIAGLAAQDILYVAAAGNDDSNTDRAQLNYPSNYDADNIVAVAATNRQDDIATFSQYGPISADVAAPGLQIVTTAIQGTYFSNPGVSGTSFSSPYTAGVAALLKSHVVPQPSAAEIKARLIESGSAAAGANPRLKTAGGRIDADLALEMSPRPSLVITAVSFSDGNNNVPDPGETLDVSFTVRNLWQAASATSATLAADSSITVNTANVALGTIATNGSAVATFSITVPTPVTEHRYINFALSLSANAGAYTATRAANAEIGTLALDAQVTQGFTATGYDEFHDWHVEVPSGVGTRTLLISTNTAGGEDIDVLVKRNAPPQYSITVGINPETQFGFFCTSGTDPNCDDPATHISAGLNGHEMVSVVDPQPGTYHIVVVNFDQAAVDYTIEATVANGDLRPDPFSFVARSGVPGGTTTQSNEVLITGLTAAAPIFISGGEYSIDGGLFVSTAGTINNTQRVRVQANTGLEGTARAQLTIGGVTATYYVNPPASPPFAGSGDLFCGGSSGGGGMPLPLLAPLLLAALARRALRRE